LALPDGCDFGIVPNPCQAQDSRRALDRNTDAIIRALKNLCNVINPDDPTDSIFNLLLSRFRLTAALTQGGNATAVRIDWNGSAWTDGDAITVYDDQTGGEWQGAIGYEGWARQVEDESTRHSIVWMQRIAYMVRGTIGGSLSGGSATLTVASYSDGVNPGATVTVHDPNGRWPLSVSGGLAQALYNFEADRYEVVQCEQSEWIAEALATQNYGPTTSTVTISSVTFKTQQEYMPDPTTPTTARNRYGLTGSSGDIILIHRSKATGEWEIVTGGSGGGTSSSSSQVHRFRLTANLQIGSSATAKRLTFNGAAYVETENIVILDRPYPVTAGTPGTTRGMWSGIASMEGFARKREVNEFGGNDEYEIIWMEAFGRFIHGTLTENMGATTAQQATATIDYLWGQGDAVTTATIQVHDDDDRWHFALAGAKFTAIRNEYLDTGNPQTPYYTLVCCQQNVLYGKAQLVDAAMCPADTQVEITQFKGWTPSLFNQQLPEGQPLTANNPYGCAAQNGDALYIVGDFSDPNAVVWNIIQAQHYNLLMVTQIRRNDTTRCIEYKDASVAVMLCEPESDWKTLICGRVCQNA